MHTTQASRRPHWCSELSQRNRAQMLRNEAAAAAAGFAVVAAVAGKGTTAHKPNQAHVQHSRRVDGSQYQHDGLDELQGGWMASSAHVKGVRHACHCIVRFKRVSSQPANQPASRPSMIPTTTNQPTNRMQPCMRQPGPSRAAGVGGSPPTAMLFKLVSLPGRAAS